MTRGSTFQLPPRPYVPGRTERPDASFFEAAKSGLRPGLPVADLAASAAFRAGREAFQHGYFWEAHELWEAVWACLPPASAERHLLRGLIQLANAGLKRRMGRPGAVARIAKLADAALREAFLRDQDGLMGLRKAEIGELRNRALGNTITCNLMHLSKPGHRNPAALLAAEVASNEK